MPPGFGLAGRPQCHVLHPTPPQLAVQMSTHPSGHLRASTPYWVLHGTLSALGTQTACCRPLPHGSTKAGRLAGGRPPPSGTMQGASVLLAGALLWTSCCSLFRRPRDEGAQTLTGRLLKERTCPGHPKEGDPGAQLPA